MYRKSYVEIDQDRFFENIEYLKNRSGKAVIPVLKANGYGTLDFYLAKEVEKRGIKPIAVSSLEEALHLRKHDIQTDILILGYVNPKDFDLVRSYDLSVVTVDEEELFHSSSWKDIKVHIKIDTGMHRIGIKPENALPVLQKLMEDGATIKGIMTHFACSDENTEEETRKQFHIFEEVVKKLNYPLEYIHTSNTDATIHFPDDLTTHVRPGIGLLGLSSFQSDLKPCVSLYSEIISIRTIKDGEGVGYGHHHTSDGKGYYAVLPIGYADGFWRSNVGEKVYIDGEYAEIVGNICMDQTIIHTTKEYPVGTKVELFGEHISLSEKASRQNTIPYELLTSLSDRLTRVFVDCNKNILFEYNPRFHE